MSTYQEKLTAWKEKNNVSTGNYTIKTTGSLRGKVSPEYGEDTYADKLAFVARMGMSDTWRGVKQLLGTDEEQMAEDQKRLNMYLQNEQYGGSMMAAYTAGLFGDPVGWFIPGMKAKNLASAAKAGAIAGGLTAPLGYVDEEEGMSRVNNTLIGIAGGGTLSPALYKFNKTIAPAMGKAYGDAGEAINKGIIGQSVRNVGRGIKGGKDTRRGKVFDNIGGYVIENYGLPKGFVTAKGNRRLMENKWAGDFNEVLQKFEKLTPEQDRALYRLMTDEKLSKSEMELMTPDIKALGKEGRTLVNKLGKELVDLKLLDADVFKANKKKYLYRSYEKTADPRKKRIVRDENNVGVIASEFVRRGRDKTFRPRKGQTLAARIKEEEANGYRVISKAKGNKSVLMNKDFTPEQRKQMGEIISSTFAMAKTGKLMSNDVATFKFYDDISKMGDDVILPKNVAPENIPEGFKQIPKDFVRVGKKSSRVREFGNLSGRWVSPEVHRDLVWANRMKKYRQGRGGLGGFGQLHHKALQYWKRTKTSLNPVVHMNNIMSNVVLYDLVDGSYKHLGSAGKDFYKAFGPGTKFKSDDFKMAEKLGVFNADMMKRELTNFEIDTYTRYMKIGKQNDSQLLDNMWESTKKHAGKTPLDKLYSAEDGVFRLALFKDHLAKNVREGLTPTDDQYAEAATFARKYMLDYEIDAPAVELMRETAMPFISYTYRAAPIVAETMLKRPWKIAKWGLILNAANDLAADDEEYRTERKRQDELNMGFDVLGIPGANTLIKLPNEKYLDVSRWIPAGDVLSTETQGFGVPGLPAPLQPSGGALGGIAKAVTGFDTFTKQTVPGVGSGVFEDAAKARASIIAKEFLPFFNQGRNIWDSYKANGQRHPTKDDRTLNESLLGAIGIKVKTYDEKKMKSRVSYKYQNKLSSLEKKLKQKARDRKGGRIDNESYKKESERIKKELRRISKEAKEALKRAN